MEGLGIGGYAMQEQYSNQNSLSTAKMARMPTLKERCDMAVAQAEERLAAVKRAREILDQNPDLEELLNIMQKAHF